MIYPFLGLTIFPPSTLFKLSIHHKMMYVKHFTSFCDIIYLMDKSKEIGINIKEARKAKGMTQKQVAEIMKMTQQQYSRFENGIFQLNYEQIIFLCNLYDITPNDIFGIY